MTLEELIQRRGVDRPSYQKQGLPEESAWAKGYWAGWESAYNDLKEILIQNNFNLSITVISDEPVTNVHNENERCYDCFLQTNCEKARHIENYRLKGCHKFISDRKVMN